MIFRSVNTCTASMFQTIPWTVSSSGVSLLGEGCCYCPIDDCKFGRMLQQQMQLTHISNELTPKTIPMTSTVQVQSAVLLEESKALSNVW